MRGGCQWSKRFSSMENGVWLFSQVDGKLKKIHDMLVKEVRKMVGKNETPSVGIIDSQSVKTTQKGDQEDMMPVKK